MSAELLNDIYITLLISMSFVVLAPVFYWLLTDVRDWQQHRA